MRKRAFIVEAGPANAISGEIKWERWGEREISIFHEPFPLLPLGSLWPSAPSRLPSSLIPFSKNVITKSPFGLSAATLTSCAGWPAHSYITARLSLSLSPLRQSLHLFSQVVHAISSVRWRTHVSSTLVLKFKSGVWPPFLFISSPHSHQVQPLSKGRHE